MKDQGENSLKHYISDRVEKLRLLDEESISVYESLLYYISGKSNSGSELEQINAFLELITNDISTFCYTKQTLQKILIEIFYDHIFLLIKSYKGDISKFPYIIQMIFQMIVQKLISVEALDPLFQYEAKKKAGYNYFINFICSDIDFFKPIKELEIMKLNELFEHLLSIKFHSPFVAELLELWVLIYPKLLRAES